MCQNDSQQGTSVDASASADCSAGPYLMKTITTVIRLYNSQFGDQRKCVCGHSYERHFDGYEEPDEQDVGCKYCDCHTFVEAQ